jgi:hypothetical protein
VKKIVVLFFSLFSNSFDLSQRFSLLGFPHKIKHYIMLELLKNAMRATMDNYIKERLRQKHQVGDQGDSGSDDVGDDDDDDDDAVTHQESSESLHYSPLARYQRMQGHRMKSSNLGSKKGTKKSSSTPPVDDIDYSDLPPVTVTIADSPSNEDVIIKVSDEGGGIPRSQMDSVWSYLYTTANNTVQERVLQQQKSTAQEQLSSLSSLSDGDAEAPHVANAAAALGTSPILAGLGFGLPMARAYARYFGGDLDLISLEGYGTDAYVHLVRLDDKRHDEYT